MKFVVEYRTLFSRLIPKPPIVRRGRKIAVTYSIRCARFRQVWRRGAKIVEAPSAQEAECYFIAERRWRGKDREVLSVKRYHRKYRRRNRLWILAR